jgi:hypothetical protein
MKTLRQIVELKKIDLIPDPDLQAGQISDYANPKSEAEKNFIGKHLDNIQTQMHPAFRNQAEQDAVFKGGNIQKDHSKPASYKDNQDAEVYEAAIQFVQDNLTEENLEKFNQLLEDDYEAGLNFALEVVDGVDSE